MYTRELVIIQFYPLACYFLPLLDKNTLLSTFHSNPPLGSKPQLQAHK
jgi:hypothetical protein